MKDLSLSFFRIGGVALAFTLTVSAADWPEWGGSPSKNMVSPEVGLPVDFAPGEEKDDDSGDIDLTDAKNCKWVVTLGSEAYGTPTIGSGKVLVGTNNERPRNEKLKGDRGILMCFDEKTGAFQWQLAAPKLPGGDAVDWEYLGICSSALIRDNLAYIMTNRGEVACLDMEGLANGNAGFAKEDAYLGGPGKDPIKPGKTDADIVWVYDMIGGVGSVPHNITSSSAAIVDGIIMATTSNGVDEEHEKVVAPKAPCLIALNAKSGALHGKEDSGIGKRTLHCNWSSPCIGKVKGKDAVFFGAGDGFLYAFDPKSLKEGKLEELWRYDCNPSEYRVDDEGKKREYPSFKGPSEIVGTPVFHEGKVYVAIGQDPEYGDGVGMLSCVNADTGESVWSYKGISRSLSTASISKGVLYIPDFSGQIHCLDAAKGKLHWKHDTLSRIWGSTLVADGKIYIGTEDGEVIILKEGTEKEELGVAQFSGPIYSSVVAANSTLYVQTQTHLHAFSTKK